ncbi:cytochrome c peroxidase [Flammeovirgaceae bacterium SG7u.111]|nr:cytochrome c peroxidase [Flammeovirgaceae bacterium SG7u.132]WPO33756.1 cytochrome c peroxidase [Flammeovirgaceae bacterium SG7u.111]
MKTARLLLFCSTLFFGLAIFNACQQDVNPSTGETEFYLPTPYEFPDMDYFPRNLNIPSDNPMTVEGVKLGRYLFYDGRLSGRTHPDSLMSCSSCHNQEKGFDFAPVEADQVYPKGLPSATYPEGKQTSHTGMALVNLVYNHKGYLWNGFVHEDNELLGSSSYQVPADSSFHYQNIESLVWMSIAAPHEMNGSIEQTVKTIAGIDSYKPMFRDAFGSEEVNIDRISKAIAQFVRSIVSYRSKFHQYMREEAELTALETRGMELFFSEEGDCFHCHGGSVLMTTNLFYNNAKDKSFFDSKDRFAITADVKDKGAYRAPSLINAAVRSPYMHDGRYTSLDEVIDFYSDGLVDTQNAHPLMKQVKRGGVRLNKDDKVALKAFVLSLTDYDLLSDPQYSRPEDLRDGSKSN